MFIEIIIFLLGVIGVTFSVLFVAQAFSLFKKSSKLRLPNTVTINSRDREIVIGVGVFPDSMVLPVGIEAGFYNNVHLNIKVAYLDWNKIFDHLIAEDVSIIIGNKTLCDEKNSIKTFFTYHQDVHFYNAFSIMVRPTSNATTYLELHNRYKRSSDGELRIETLRQLKGMRVIASKDTDHLTSLVSCAQMAGLALHKDFEVIGAYEPYEGVKRFIELGEGDAYVGGISQRIIALRAGMKELIAQDHTDLGLQQRNGFITATYSQKASSQLLEQLSYAWFETVRAIRKDNEKYIPMILKYLNMQIDKYHIKYHFTQNDFHLYWDNWEKFPSTQKESEELLGRIIPLKTAIG